MLAPARAAAATPADDLAQARDSFRRGDYGEAIPRLNYLLYPEPRLADMGELVEAHVLLGVSHYETGDRKTAAREFEEALFIDPSVSLDRLLFSEGAIEYFEDTREKLAERTRQGEEIRRLAEERDRLRRALANLVVIEKRSYYVNFIPFGAGQFQNGQDGKGIAFAAVEAALGGASAGIWGYQALKYGFGGAVPRGDVATVRRMQEVQVATGIACLGVMAWGIVDSLLNYEPKQQIDADPSLIPASAVESTSLAPSLVPLPTPGGLGVGAHWRF